MKIQQILYYKTSTGLAVETVAEWKQAEMVALLTTISPATGDVDQTIVRDLAGHLIGKSEQLIEILSVREPKGRPKGAKDKQPRRKPTTDQPTTP